MASEGAKRSSGKWGEVRGDPQQGKSTLLEEDGKKVKGSFGKPKILQGSASCHRGKSPPVRGEIDYGSAVLWGTVAFKHGAIR